MPGIQKWKEDEIWFILNKKRGGATNLQILPQFQANFPKHPVQKQDPAPINYVWNHYSYRPEYAPERFDDFLARYNAEREVQKAVRAQRAAMEEQSRAARQSAIFTPREGSSASLNDLEPSKMTASGPTQNSLAPHIRSVSGGPIRATFNFTQPLNFLTSSLPPPSVQVFTQDPSRERSEEPSHGVQGTYNPNSPFPASTSTQSPLAYSSQHYLPIDLNKNSSPFQSITTIHSNRIAKKPKRPAPTSVLRSNAKFTGFRFRRNSSELASKPPPSPSQRQRLLPRRQSPPVAQYQPLPKGPVEVARFEGFWMTYDPNDSSGLPYAVYTPDGRRIRDGSEVPQRVFDELSALSSIHPATYQELFVGDIDNTNDDQCLPSVNSSGKMQDQEPLYVFNGSIEGYNQKETSVSYSAQNQCQGQANTSLDQVEQTQGQVSFPNEGPQPTSVYAIQIPPVQENSTLSLFNGQGIDTNQQGNMTAQAHSNNGNMQHATYRMSNSNGYNNGQGPKGVIHPDQSIHAQLIEAYPINQNSDAPALAAAHHFNHPPAFHHSAATQSSNLHVSSVLTKHMLQSDAEPSRHMSPNAGESSIDQTRAQRPSSNYTGQTFSIPAPLSPQMTQLVGNCNMQNQNPNQAVSGQMSDGARSQLRVQGSMTPQQSLQALQAFAFGSGAHQTIPVGGYCGNASRTTSPMGTPQQTYQNQYLAPGFVAATASMISPSPSVTSGAQFQHQVARNTNFSSSSNFGPANVPFQPLNSSTQNLHDNVNTDFASSITPRRASDSQVASVPVPYSGHESRYQASSAETSCFLGLPDDDFMRAMNQSMEMSGAAVLDGFDFDAYLEGFQTPCISNQKTSFGLGISMNGEAMASTSPNVQNPGRLDAQVSGSSFRAASASQGYDRMINISGATFVAPFIIPSLGTGWALSASDIPPQSSSSGPVHGSFSIGNSGISTVININDSIFQLGIEFEDIIRTRGSVSSCSSGASAAASTALSPPSSTTRRSSSRVPNRKMAAPGRSEKIKIGGCRPHAKTRQPENGTIQMGGMSPSYAKRPADEFTQQPSSVKRSNTQTDVPLTESVAESVPKYDTRSAGSPPPFVLSSPAPATLEPQAPTSARSQAEPVLEDLELDLELFGSPDPQSSEENEFQNRRNLWADDLDERNGVEEYDFD